MLGVSKDDLSTADFRIFPIVDPGDDFNSAFKLGNLNIQEIFEDSVGTDDRIDFYSFTLTENSEVRLNLTGLTDTANLGIVADLDEDGIFDTNEYIQEDDIDDFFTSTNDRSISTNLAPGEYFIYVFTYNQSQNTGYTLTALATAIESTPVEDPGNTLDDAFVIDSLAEEQTFTQVVGSLDRTDFYKFTLVENSEVRLNLTGLSNTANLGIVADLNEDGIFNNTDYIAADNIDDTFSSTDDRSILRSLAPGEYFIYVFTYRESQNTDYTLTASATVIESIPVEDPGNTLNDAFVIDSLSEEQTFTQVVGSLDRTDFYKFTLAENSEVRLNLTGLSNTANLGIVADLDENGIFDNTDYIERDNIDDTFSSTDDRSIFTNLEAGEYFIYVFTYRESQNTGYILSASLA